MLLFFGTRSSDLGTYPLPGVACAHCGTPDAVTVAVFSHYLHVFWIPVFPFSKRVVSVCRHCKQVLEPDEWPQAYQLGGQAARAQARFPLTHYSGLLIGGLLLLVLAGLSLFAGAS